jgi:hypothetical protein
MKGEKYYFTDIIRRLEQYIHCDVGAAGFKTLLYGWRIFHGIPVYNFYGRDYMNEKEILSFSKYAGYDLSKDPF